MVIEAKCFFVIYICDFIIVNAIINIGIRSIFCRIALEEQIAIRANGSGIAVGDIHEIIFAVVHRYDIPHMRACSRAAAHRTGHQMTFDVGTVKVCQIAQVLKGLGIAFTNDGCALITVEHVHQLPWIAVSNVIIVVCGVIVIGHQGTDLIHIALQFFQVTFVFVFFDNFLGFLGCGNCSCHFV